MTTLAQLHDCHSCNDERSLVQKKTWANTRFLCSGYPKKFPTDIAAAITSDNFTTLRDWNITIAGRHFHWPDRNIKFAGPPYLWPDRNIKFAGPAYGRTETSNLPGLPAYGRTGT